MSIKRMQELAGLEPKQTAIEWLEDKLDYILPLEFEWDRIEKIFEEAKEMEKEQITDAYYMGSQDAPIKKGQSEIYYQETFK